MSEITDKLINGPAAADPVVFRACKDCVHHRTGYHGISDFCYRILRRNPVTGEYESVKSRSEFCEVERVDYGPGIDTCGPHAKYFKARQLEPRKWWEFWK